MKVELQDGAPPGTMFACYPSGWMQTDIFTQWFDHFLKHTKPSAEDPVLLILDGHATHTKNIDFIEKARNNHTTVVCLPPHCSHKLQPLDVAFMAPFNTFYVQAIEKFLRNNPGRVVTQFQVSKLLGDAFLRAALPSTAINGFRKCGIVPLDPDVFTDADFAAAETTEIPVTNDKASAGDEDDPVAGDEDDAAAHEEGGTVAGDKDCFTMADGEDDLAVDCSTKTADTEHLSEVSQELQNIPLTIQVPEPQPSTSFSISPRDIVPLPRSNISKRKTTHKKGKAAVITSSPYKLELLQEKEKKEKDENNKKRKKEAKESQSKKSKRIEPKTKKIKTLTLKKKALVNSKRKLFVEEFDEDEADNEDTECFYCNEAYSNSKTNEGWIRCSGCQQWAHEECAGCEEEDDDFLCENCK